MPLSTLAAILDRLSAGGVALAFSGGTDSTALLELFLRRGADVLALHFTGPHLDSAHSRAVLAGLRERRIPCLAVECNALDIAEVRQNSPRRCYFCKRRAFGLLGRAAGGRVLCDGTNASDLGGYRPGLAALRELGVRSPFAEAGLDKTRIRALAGELGLTLPPAGGQNCLLTRFAYGLEITERDLRALENAEAEIRRTLALPTPLNFRLRRLEDGKSELHVEAAGPLPGALSDRLSSLLAARGLPGTPVTTMDNIGGFFDRARTNDSNLI